MTCQEKELWLEMHGIHQAKWEYATQIQVQDG